MRPPVLPPSLLDGIAGWALKITSHRSGKPSLRPAGPCDVCVAVRAIDVIEKGEEDLVVRRKMRIKRDIQQAMSFAAGDASSRTPARGSESTPLVSRRRYAARESFGQENLAVRQEGEAHGAGRLSISVVILKGAMRERARGLFWKCRLVRRFFPVDASRWADPREAATAPRRTAGR